MRSLLLFSCAVFLSLQTQAQIPSGYYSPAAGLDGEALRTALHNIIDDHTSLGYSGLWDAFDETDSRADGKVWDIYTDIPGPADEVDYTFFGDQCGSYDNEGDCYNREHTWPQSYFAEAEPMKSDLFQVYPTDGFVNGKRSNYPYGEVSTATYTSENGSRLGSNTYPGYSGIVFEPRDEYKGDLARTYFYMSTRYKGEDAGWESWGAANGADLKAWTAAMLLEWHHADPVDAKELARNEAIYDLQDNRNPFIDHPEYADCIWSPAGCLPTGITENTTAANIIVSPNPAVDRVEVRLSQAAAASVMLLSLDGRLAYHAAFNSAAHTINISSLPRGMYILQLRMDTGIEVRKILLQ